MASPDFFTCLASVFHPPYGVYGVLICIGLLAILLLMVMRMGYSDTGEYDTDRNFIYSAKGTYGTSGWMSRKEMAGVLDLVPDLRKHIPSIRSHPSSVPARHPPISPNGAGWNRSNRNPLRRSQSRRLPRLKSQ